MIYPEAFITLQTELYLELHAALPELPLLAEELLSQHTSFRIGGPAEVFAQPRSAEELAALLRFAATHGVEPVLLGAGTNVVAPDDGLRGLVICTKGTLTGLRRCGETDLEAECGVTLAKLASFARDLGLTGLEFAHGIPGTVGGGMYMNAGAYGGEMKQVAVQTEVLLPGGERAVLRGEEQALSYRHSAFMERQCIVLRTVFRLMPGNREAISARMAELSQRRRSSQPLELPSAGSFFKRPALPDHYAGAMIQQAGLKGFTVGGAQVSEKHAGFVVNIGGATAADLRQLTAEVQRRVYAQTGVMLEPEVRFL